MSASIRMPKLLAVLVVAALALFAAVVPASSAHAAATYSISGKVTLPSGAPASWLKGVWVVARSTNASSITTDVDPSTGTYTLTGVPAGEYTIGFMSDVFYDSALGELVTPNLVDEYYNNQVDYAKAGKVKVVSSNLTNINATLALGRTISGKVTVPAGTPVGAIEAITVVAYENNIVYARYASVDPVSGTYSITGLAPGSYTVAFETDDYYDLSAGKYVPSYLAPEVYNNLTTYAGANAVSVVSSNAMNINATLVNGKSLSGKVTLPVGAPAAWLNGVRVMVDNGDFWKSVRVDTATGNYTVTGLVSGNYSVNFYALPYFDETAGKSVTPNLKDEYYNNSATYSASTKVALGSSNVTGINALMDYKTVSTFTAAPAPTITGTPAVGTKLGVNLGTWSPKPDSMTYQWYRDGVAISGAKYYQYTLQSADAGHQVSVAATAVKAGYASVTKSSARVTVPLQTFSATGTPTVTGTLAVGSKVTANPGTWTPTPGAFTYQWYRDGVAISGATASQYTLAAADAGHQVSVGVTGQKTGFKSAAKASARVSVPYSTFTTAPTPTITGTLAAGNKLTINLGSWSPKPDAVKYQWYRDGVAISGATSYQYTLTATDKGRQISVAVTASKAGYKSVVKASTRVSVAP